MNTIIPTRRPKPSEEGYILVAVMFMLAILVIAASVAAPKIARQIQRDREVETMHRGKQYARAVKLYYKQFNAYPPNVDALVKTNEIRFLRKKYLDPMTGKDDWKTIALGQNKTPTAFGFFGAPLTGSGMGGGLCGNALPNSTGPSTSTIGSTSNASGSSFGSAGSFGATSPTAGCPSTTPGSGSSTDLNSTSGTTDPNAQNGSTPPGGDPSGTNPSGGQSPTGASGAGTSGPATSGTGLTGPTFGGAGIMGFSPGSPKQSILVYKKKNHYNEWEFVYDPIADQMMMQGGNAGAIGTPLNGANGNPTNGSGSPIGNGTTTGGSGLGTSGTTSGGSGTNGTNPQPQQ